MTGQEVCVQEVVECDSWDEQQGSGYDYSSSAEEDPGEMNDGWSESVERDISPILFVGKVNVQYRSSF